MLSDMIFLAEKKTIYVMSEQMLSHTCICRRLRMQHIFFSYYD